MSMYARLDRVTRAMVGSAQAHKVEGDPTSFTPPYMKKRITKPYFRIG